MEAIEEMLPFLDVSSRLDLKSVALQHVLGLTGSKDGVKLLSQMPKLLSKLVPLMSDETKSIAKDASLALINLSADKDAAKTILEIDAVPKLWERIETKESIVADPACMVLSNLTIEKNGCDRTAQALDEAGISLEKIAFVFCQEKYNSKGAGLNYLGPFLSNLSQLSGIRKQILDRTGCVVQRLLPYTEYKSSKVRRGGVIATLKNCCFETDDHEWLLSPEVDILPRLLLPLAGPTPDDLDPEEIEMLPMDLQYLDESKEVEEDPDLRKMLLEAITQLCATKKCREIVRKNSAYFILRQLHKSEKDKHVRLACENLVDLLIKKEEEINVENYHDVVVPEDVVPELEEMDKNYLKE